MFYQIKKQKKTFVYANDLVMFIQKQGGFNIIGACYPEMYAEVENLFEDIKCLKRKVDFGTNQLITQLFFDNNYFYTFKEKCKIANIAVLIQAGIMPVVNKRQSERIVKMSKVTLPPKFLKMMERYEHNLEAIHDYAINQIVDLIAQKIRDTTRSLIEVDSIE